MTQKRKINSKGFPPNATTAFGTEQEIDDLKKKVRKLQKENRDLKRVEIFKDSDLVLPLIPLLSPVEIEICIQLDTVQLTVGQRDWSWERKSGQLIGAGTRISTEVETNEESTTDVNPVAPIQGE